MARAINPDQVMKKWAEGGANSAAVVKAGVQGVTENPAAKAAARVDAYIKGVQNAKDKFVASLQRVTLQDWKNAMLGKGITNMQNGYADATNQAKFLLFMRMFLPYVREGAEQVRAMEKGTLQKGIDRAVAMIRWNANFRGKAGVAPPIPRAN